MDGGKTDRPWYFNLVVVIAILAISQAERLAEHNLFIPLVIGIFAAVFGVLLWQGIRQWKKSDEEILEGFSFKKTGYSKDPDPVKSLLVGAAFTVFVLFKTEFAVSGIVFCCIAMLISALPLISQILEKRNGNRPALKRRISGQHVAAFLIGLIPSLFMCFFIGIGCYHGAWWFVLPPGLILLLSFSRPLVAAVRSVARNYRDAGEQHLRTKKETDPWDRPDVDPEQYWRK